MEWGRCGGCWGDCRSLRGRIFGGFPNLSPLKVTKTSTEMTCKGMRKACKLGLANLLSFLFKKLLVIFQYL